MGLLLYTCTFFLIPSVRPSLLHPLPSFIGSFLLSFLPFLLEVPSSMLHDPFLPHHSFFLPFVPLTSPPYILSYILSFILFPCVIVVRFAIMSSIFLVSINLCQGRVPLIRWPWRDFTNISACARVFHLLVCKLIPPRQMQCKIPKYEVVIKTGHQEHYQCFGL